jgi:hypothetical protein
MIYLILSIPSNNMIYHILSIPSNNMIYHILQHSIKQYDLSYPTEFHQTIWSVISYSIPSNNMICHILSIPTNNMIYHILQHSIKQYDLSYPTAFHQTIWSIISYSIPSNNMIYHILQHSIKQYDLSYPTAFHQTIWSIISYSIPSNNMIYHILQHSIEPGSDLNFIVIEVSTLHPHDRWLLLHVFGLLAACQVYGFDGRVHFQRSQSMWTNNIFTLKAIISRCKRFIPKLKSSDLRLRCRIANSYRSFWGACSLFI